MRHGEFQPRGAFELQELKQTNLKSKQYFLCSIYSFKLTQARRPDIRKQHDMPSFPADDYPTQKGNKSRRGHETIGMGRQKLFLVTSRDYCFNFPPIGRTWKH